jgi:predicted metalloprotease
LKLTSLALGLLTVTSLAPSAQAIPIDVGIFAVQHPDGDLHSQVILNVNPQVRRESGYNHRWEGGQRQRQEAERRRQFELAREREEQARLAAKRLRRQQYAKYHNNSYGGYRDNGGYQSEYRHDR